MKPSIYAEMCKPSPLSKPPKQEVKMLTFDELLKEAQKAVALVGTGKLKSPDLVKDGAHAHARPELLKP